MTLSNKTLSISQSEDIGDSCRFLFFFFPDQMLLVSSTFPLGVDAPGRVLFIKKKKKSKAVFCLVNIILDEFLLAQSSQLGSDW